MHADRYIPFIAVIVATVLFSGLAVALHDAYWAGTVVFGALTLVGIRDLFQTDHSLTRVYPVIGHGRYLMERIRPEIQQYFVESDTDGRPFPRDARNNVYRRAKDTISEEPFGTLLDVYAEGHEWLAHSLAPTAIRAEQFRVRIGGPDCTQPYEASLLNIAAMSYGSLSSNAIAALNRGAAMGDFMHDSGEGSISPHHEQGGDLFWEIGSGYFGARDEHGRFDLERFREKATREQVKGTHIKLSQGAKPGLGGVMPAAKVSPEIAAIRGVPVGRKVVSPARHTAFDTPVQFLQLLAAMREASGGKPVGFKLCVGRRAEFLAIVRAMVETGITPDFIMVDGAEGGTGAAPLEFEDWVGMPLTDGLMIVHNALVGAGLRDRITIGASGKITQGSDIAKRMAIGADFTLAARAMMLAIGCIQARRCETNECPVGVATQDPARVRGLVVSEKDVRVANYHRNTMIGFNKIVAAMGLDDPSELGPDLLVRRVSQTETASYAELYPWLRPDSLVDGVAPPDWQRDWDRASASSFTVARELVR